MVMSVKDWNSSSPALVTMISTGPSSARTFAIASSTAARSDDVGLGPDRARTGGAEVGGGLRRGVGVEVEERDPVPGGREALRHRQSHACCGARDDGDPAHRFSSDLRVGREYEPSRE